MGEFITNVNVPNQGQVREIPNGAVVETNAVLSYGSVRPVLAGELPKPVQKSGDAPCNESRNHTASCPSKRIRT
ncbi:hypothetical protein GCM10020331_098230 [Ectobacillus funiculus]